MFLAVYVAVCALFGRDVMCLFVCHCWSPFVCVVNLITLYTIHARLSIPNFIILMRLYMFCPRTGGIDKFGTIGYNETSIAGFLSRCGGIGCCSPRTKFGPRYKSDGRTGHISGVCLQGANASRRVSANRFGLAGDCNRTGISPNGVQAMGHRRKRDICTHRGQPE